MTEPTTRTTAAIAAALLLAATGPAAADGNAAAGRKKAMQCAPCHGIDGIAKLPNAANLAGETTFYLEKQLHAFRKGERVDENMTVVVKDLSDQDIADLAAWYASIQISVTLPPR